MKLYLVNYHQDWIEGDPDRYPTDETHAIFSTQKRADEYIESRLLGWKDEMGEPQDKDEKRWFQKERDSYSVEEYELDNPNLVAVQNA